jgi:hypothetical protein
LRFSPSSEINKIKCTFPSHFGNKKKKKFVKKRMEFMMNCRMSSMSLKPFKLISQCYGKSEIKMSSLFQYPFYVKGKIAFSLYHSSLSLYIYIYTYISLCVSIDERTALKGLKKRWLRLREEFEWHDGAVGVGEAEREWKIELFWLRSREWCRMSMYTCIHIVENGGNEEFNKT